MDHKRDEEDRQGPKRVTVPDEFPIQLDAA